MGTDWYIPDRYQYNYNYGSDWSSLPSAIHGVLIGVFILVCLICVALLILQIVGMAKTFKKAGQKGWAAIIPFYNTFTLIKISGLELWWFILLSILPLAAIQVSNDSAAFVDVSTAIYIWVASFISGISIAAMQYAVNYKIAKSFGKNVGFAIGLSLAAPIFWMVLGCSSDIKYKGPAGPFKIKYPEAPHKK